MNNTVCGKTMENLRNKIDVRLAKNEKDYLKRTSKPGYMSQKTFDHDLMAICKSEATLASNKPAYAGVCKLDLSKVLMYEFNYDYIKNKYDNNSRLLLTDNDSLMYESKPKDAYEDFIITRGEFDFSNYSAESKHDSNKLVFVLARWKIKQLVLLIKEFVGLY